MEQLTVQGLIRMLLALPNQQAKVYVWDPDNESSGEIQRVQDIHHPTDHTEVYLITNFG